MRLDIFERGVKFLGVLIEAKDVCKKYNENEQALYSVSTKIMENSFVTIVGPSGSGKSTLMNIISGLQKPTSGDVILEGKSIVNLSKNELADIRAKKFGHIFQEYNLMQNLTVKENIYMGKTNTEELNFDEIVETLGINKLLNKYPYEMSGGEQQRTSVARALIKKPKVIFCDEATGALDENNSKNVVSLLVDIKKRYGMTIVFVTHNLEIAKVSERIITMKNGIIFKDEINENPIDAQNMNWA